MGPERLLLSFVLAACVLSFVSSLNITDLSHKLDPKNIPRWPSTKTFTVSDDSPRGSDINIRSFCMDEHTGTHVDAPYHFYRGGHKLHQIPLERLIAPGVVVNIKHRAMFDHRTEVTVEDLQAWEEQHEMIPKHSIVIMASGWSSRWGTPWNYFGGDPNYDENFKFPGFSVEAADFLAHNRSVAGVGVDTPSVDVGGSSQFPVHRLLAKANIYCLENLNKVDELPPKGATIYAIPIFMKDGTGAPARVFAVMEEENNNNGKNKDNGNENDDNGAEEDATNLSFRRLTSAGVIGLAVLISLVPALLC